MTRTHWYHIILFIPLLSHKFIRSRYILQLFKQYKSVIYSICMTGHCHDLIFTLSHYYCKRGFMCQAVLKIVTRYYWSMCSWYYVRINTWTLKQHKQIRPWYGHAGSRHKFFQPACQSSLILEARSTDLWVNVSIACLSVSYSTAHRAI